MAAVRQFARRHKTDGAVERINAAVLVRLQKSGKGISTRKEVMTEDINAARLMKETPEAPRIELLPRRGCDSVFSAF